MMVLHSLDSGQLLPLSVNEGCTDFGITAQTQWMGGRSFSIPHRDAILAHRLAHKTRTTGAEHDLQVLQLVLWTICDRMPFGPDLIPVSP